ncbi:hypothetical protein [Microbacterium sp.]|uniref:hypothetical protein n=1 Tax=Microbacterium sp. TaxID=51671 RepID=UPI003C1DE331
MGYNFVDVDCDQPFLLPPSLSDWLPADHLAWFILDTVAELDLTEFVKAYRADGRGGPLCQAGVRHPAVVGLATEPRSTDEIGRWASVVTEKYPSDREE